MSKVLRPGQPAPDSGQYGVIGSNGRPTKLEITAIKNKPLPPTPEPGQGYILVDPTKHKK